jgi:hypothetical protein
LSDPPPGTHVIALFSKRITTTRGRLVAIVALIVAVACAPSAFGAQRSTLDVARSALHLSKRADRNATRALKPVDSSRIKDGAVRGVDLADGTISSADLSAGALNGGTILDGSVASADIATGGVTAADILDATITDSDLGADSVNTSKIQDGQIQSGDLAADSVTSAKILDGTIVAADVASGAVDSAQIAASAVTGDKVQNGALGLDDIAGTQGSTVIDPPQLVSGACSVVTTVVPSLQNGDRVVVSLTSLPSDATEVDAMTATAGTMRVRVCNRADIGQPDDDSPAFSVSYFVLR